MLAGLMDFVERMVAIWRVADRAHEQPPPKTPSGIDFVWREAVRLIDLQLRLGTDLDSKTGPTIAGTLAGIGVLAAQTSFTPEATGLLELELMVVLVLLVLSFRFRNFAYAPALPALLEWANSEPNLIRPEFISNLRDAYLLNLDSLSVKLFYLRWAQYALVAAALTLVASVLGGRS
jgi:hypothetical protein